MQVLFSEDMPVLIEIVDSDEKIRGFLPLLHGFQDIGLVSTDDVTIHECSRPEP